MTTVRHLAILLGSFAAVTGIVAALGAANLGTAATAGQIAFVIALMALFLSGSQRK